MKRYLPQLALFALLVAIAAVGRLNAPVWHFTPLAAVGLFAGRLFSSRALAVAVPLSALLISDLAEPQHLNFGVMLTVYAAMAAPAFMGSWLKRASTSRLLGFARWAVCLLGPSLLFFVTTNFAVWALQSSYDKSLAGLMQCYAAAVEFYRPMLAGDLFYAATLFGAASLAGVQWKELPAAADATKS